MAIRITGNIGLLIRWARERNMLEQLEQLLIDNYEYGESGNHSIGRDIFIIDADREHPEISVKSFGFHQEKPPFFPQYPPTDADPRIGVGGLNAWPGAENNQWTFNS